ncbi:MAG: hypothetical protein K6B43_02080 [Treponema sp.]|nr:hypothetical protein [Treponema sp.]
MKEFETTLEIKADSEFFDGHFPSFPLMPAVAQLDLVAHVALVQFSVPVRIKKIKRIKFNEKILPGAVVFLKIVQDDTEDDTKKIMFEMKSCDGKILYSSGVYFV